MQKWQIEPMPQSKQWATNNADGMIEAKKLAWGIDPKIDSLMY